MWLFSMIDLPPGMLGNNLQLAFAQRGLADPTATIIQSQATANFNPLVQPSPFNQALLASTSAATVQNNGQPPAVFPQNTLLPNTQVPQTQPILPSTGLSSLSIPTLAAALVSAMRTQQPGSIVTTATGTGLRSPNNNVITQLQQRLNPGNDPDVARFINAGSTDPEVAQLMVDAANNGARVRFDETEPNINGFFQQRGNDRQIVISNRLRNDPNMSGLETFIHEIGHAATPEDGNSVREEAAVEVFARTKASELRNGLNLVPGRRFALPNVAQVLRERTDLYRRLEPDLPEDNGFVANLQSRGIDVLA
jgi:hypothetical protein